MATSPARRRAVVIGVLIVVVGVVAAIALWVAGSTRRSNAIENFARAPVGCDTTLDFAEGGTYLLFVESSGRLDEVRGDCDAPEEYDADVEPDEVAVTIVDPDGNDVDVDDDPPSIAYSSGDFSGRAAFEVEIADATDHVIRVESTTDDDFAVAVGRDPDDGVTLLQTLAIVLGLLGVTVGLVVALAVGRGGGGTPDWSSTQPGASPWGAPPPTQPLYRPPPSGPPSGVPPTAVPPVPGSFAPPPPPPGATGGTVPMPGAAPPPGADPSPPNAPPASPTPEWGGPTEAERGR